MSNAHVAEGGYYKQKRHMGHYDNEVCGTFYAAVFLRCVFAVLCLLPMWWIRVASALAKDG